MWRVPLRPGGQMSLGTGHYAVLRTTSSLRVLDVESGRELWQRTFPSRIQGLMGDPEHLQVTLVDTTYWLYELPTGRPFRRPDSSRMSQQQR